MIKKQKKFISRRIGLAILIVGLFVFLLALGKIGAVLASEGSIQTTDIDINPDELESIQIYYHLSTFFPWEEKFAFRVDGSDLTDGTTTIPLSSINPIIQNLHTLYPGTRPVLIQHWTDDYPYAEIVIALKDGRYLLISSQSQYGKLVPWNVQIWQGDPEGNGKLVNSYILLHDDFHEGLSKLWKVLTGNPFPRDYGDEEFWDDAEIPETIDFYLSKRNASQVDVSGAPTGVVELFLPYLEQNPELVELIKAGYRVYDLAFDVKVTTKNMHPIGYAGTLALVTPSGSDIIITTVDIQLEPEMVIDTPITKNEIDRLLSERENYEFLTKARQLFPDMVFLLDTRLLVKPLDVDCPNNPDTNQPSYSIKALLAEHSNFPIYFYYFDHSKKWSIDLRLDREQGFWDNSIAAIVLKHWFPPLFSSFKSDDLDWLSTNFGIGFRPAVSNEKNEILDNLQSFLPPETYIHQVNPQKFGDMSFVSLDGRVVIGNDGETSEVVYCDYTRPDWYSPPYRTDLVKTPEDGNRSLFKKVVVEYTWSPPRGLRDASTDRVLWTKIGVSKPGYVHLLWTSDEGVYYADGWADGSEWSPAQRLGDGSWNVNIATNTSGEVHLLWSTHFDPVGSMHVWQNKSGEWQTPEYWEGIGYFSQAILDDNSVLHFGYQDSDGLDTEFFYQNWTEQNGLSQPENISRQLGNSSDGILQLDTQHSVHAAWGHTLSKSQYIDPISGQIFDQVGVFYSRRTGISEWTLPERIGTFAYFSYSMDFILTNQDEPVVAWQSEEGIVVIVRRNDQWTEPYLLAEAIPPDTPAPFGPERSGEVTAEIRLGKDSAGNIYAAWVTSLDGLFLSRYDGETWSEPQQLSESQWITGLNMAVASDSKVHLIYFDITNPDSYPLKRPLFYSLVSEGAVKTTEMKVSFTDYGVMENQLILDREGFVYVLALPRTPTWFVYIPQGGIHPPQTPTPTITLTPTQAKPTATLTIEPSKTSTPFTDDIELESFPTAIPTTETNKGISSWIILFVVLVFVGAGFVIIRMIVKKQ